MVATIGRPRTDVSLSFSFSASLSQTNQCICQLGYSGVFDCVYIYIFLKSLLYFAVVCWCVCFYIYMCVFAWAQTVHKGSYYHSRSRQFGACALHIPLITTILNPDTLCSTKHTYKLSASTAFFTLFQAQQTEPYCPL